jgi:medium-chain acyl-[acyl-carrier-protein] hydrolase
MPVLRETFVVHTYEVDAFNLLSAPALAGYLQEAAGLHAVELACGRDVLVARGLTWVLVRQRVEIAAPILLGETLELSTWPSGVSRVAAVRDFHISRGDGTVVVRAQSHWIVMDLSSRRPVRLDKVLTPELMAEGEHVFEVPTGKLPELDACETERRFHVRYQDIDANLHVTNTSYVAWALEAVPQAVWQVRRLAVMDVQFVAECSYGAKILSRQSPGPGDGNFVHTIVCEEHGRVLARLVTHWEPRDET